MRHQIYILIYKEEKRQCLNPISSPYNPARCCPPPPLSPMVPDPLHSQGLSVCTAAHGGEGRGRQELKRSWISGVRRAGACKKIFIINKQGCKEGKGTGEAAETLTDRRTQVSWLLALALMASISAFGRTSWAHGGPLGASLPRDDAEWPAPSK